jgi:hypothetical protein
VSVLDVVKPQSSQADTCTKSYNLVDVSVVVIVETITTNFETGNCSIGGAAL